MQAGKSGGIRAFLACVFVAAMIAVAQASGSSFLILAALVVYLIVMLASSDETVFPMMLFFLPWSPILKISPSLFSVYSLATIEIFLKYLVKHKKIQKKVLLPAIALGVLTLLSKLLHGYSLSASYFMFFGMLLTFPLLAFLVREKTDFEIAACFFACGIILATLLSMAYGTNPNMIQYIKVIEYSNLGVTRLCGFYGDPNFYAAQVATALGALLLVIFKGSKRKVINIILSVVLVFCGATSLSKSFLICLVVLLVLWIISMLPKTPAKAFSALLVICVLGGAVVLSGVADDLWGQYLARFGGASDISSLTTGRTDFWAEYLKYFWEHPLSFLFGQGYTSVLVATYGSSHNTILQAIYQFGVVGTVILLVWIIAFENRSSKGKGSVMSIFWLFACFFMWLGLDILFFDDFFAVLMLCSFGFDYMRKTE